MHRHPPARIAVLAAVAGTAALGLTGCAGAAPTGHRPAGTAAVTGGGGPARAAADRTVPASPATVARRYLAAVDAADRAGSPGPLAGYAAAGCGPCAADLAYARRLAAGHDRAAGPIWLVRSVHAYPPRAGLVTVTVGLVGPRTRVVDAAGRTVAVVAATGARYASVEEVATPAGWRVCDVAWLAW